MSTLESRFQRHQACVLLPTYNNAQVLAQVLDDILQYTTQVLVVNDGSTDSTLEILAKYPAVQVLSYQPNKGKGIALQRGIREIAARGFQYALAMDSDGQHLAKDLVQFLNVLDENPGALIVGARNMSTAENVPQKSSFGNRFSNFWFWVNTGIRLPDTQSGYRCYPVQPLAKKHWYTRKYEWEIEVMVRASWSGIPVMSVPVSVYYPPAEERITHFRPFKDFTRISVLNTVLVLIAVLYIKPRDFLRLLFTREGRKRILRVLFVHPEESNARKASSVAFGVFMGIVPVWGFQLAIGIPAAIALRLNKTLFLIAAHISVFPLTPFWWMASLIAGKWLLGQQDWRLDWHSITLERVLQEGASFFLGGAVLALALGAAAYVLTWVALRFARPGR